MNVPYLDLPAQYQSLKGEIDAAIADVVAASDFVSGRAVNSFEKDFADFCGVDFCLGVNNGTNALFLALSAFGVGPGDEVITAANTFIATVEAIAHVGARPVLVDVDPVTRTINPEKLDRAITANTKAVIPVHLFGRMADMDSVMKIARNHNLRVIEDASQAHGAECEGKKAGAIGDIGTFSFYPAKNLGTFGDAGAVVTSDSDLADAIRRLRDHGSVERDRHEVIGYNARMNGIPAAVLSVKLKHLGHWNERRRQIAGSYAVLLDGLPLALPELFDDNRHVYHLYVIESERRDDLRAYLKREGVGTLVHYPVPVHLQPAFASLKYKAGDFPVTERLAQRILSLPIYPELTDDHVQFVAAKIREFLTGRK